MKLTHTLAWPKRRQLYLPVLLPTPHDAQQMCQQFQIEKRGRVLPRSIDLHRSSMYDACMRRHAVFAAAMQAARNVQELNSNLYMLCMQVMPHCTALLAEQCSTVYYSQNAYWVRWCHACIKHVNKTMHCAASAAHRGDATPALHAQLRR
jgi:hypothetical protein